ncbi:MAG: glycosyltransferase family 39 protein [Anaerolineae bacterium]|nr:glycosyltransferase family 39 protein [Anaerolineae bacterium]
MSRSSSARLDHSMLAALLLAFFAFAASVIINGSVFERLPHLEDEYAYLFQAKIFARGQAWIERQEPVKIYWQPFIIQPEQSSDGIQKRFGKYTPGWPMLLASGAAINTPWIVNAWFAMLSIALTYRLGREMFGKSVGVVAALLLAVSPMALLLNATLMSHTSAMFLTALFVYAYWRLYQSVHRDSPSRIYLRLPFLSTRHLALRTSLFWGAVAGLTLGAILISRPLTAVAVAAPVALHAAAKLLGYVFNNTRLFQRFLVPLVVLTICIIPLGSLWPIFNQIWTGDWRTNVYTLQWPYDRVGFGIGYGPNTTEGHTLAKGWRNARNDLKIYFRDLFGVTLDPSLGTYLESQFFYGLGIGLSYLLIVAGLIAGRKSDWVWLLFELLLALVVFQMAYWIGSSVNGAAAYSVRYYYEATFAVCLVSAYGVVSLAKALRPPSTNAVLSTLWLNGSGTTIRYLNGVSDTPDQSMIVHRATRTERFKRAWELWWPGYFVLLVICGVSLVGYTPARFREPLPPNWNDGLWRYNAVGQQQLDAIQKMREKYGQPTQPVLLLILHDPDPAVKDNWRDYGAALAETSPYLDSDIVVARVFEVSDISEFARRFPGRLVLYQIGANLYSSVDEALAGAAQERAES